MANQNENRVLNRMGARELTPEETQKTTGADLHTLLSVFVTGTANNPDEFRDS